MLIYDRLKEMSKLKGITITGMEAELGFARGSLCKIDKNKPSAEKMNKLASYLGTTTNFLMMGQETQDSNLTAKDERDIAKDLESIRKKLVSGENGPASYDGQELSPEASELFMDEIEIALKRLKIINKEKYNPNKNKK